MRGSRQLVHDDSRRCAIWRFRDGLSCQWLYRARADGRWTEQPPLGGDAGPNPDRLLAMAVPNCLAVSVLFAMRTFKNDPGRMRVTARVQPVRNEAKRLRIGSIDVDLHLGVPADGLAHLDRIVAQFEDFCTVTQSLRGSIPVHVRVFDAGGVQLPPR